jgi:peroxiredoxin
MAALAEMYAADGVVWLAVNSTHYMDPEASRRARAEWELPYPVLVDQDGAVGRAYGAKATPHMFVIDGAGEIVYAGAIDSDPRGGTPEVRNYVDAALADLLAGRPVAVPETQPYGCSVKYPPEERE